MNTTSPAIEKLKAGVRTPQHHEQFWEDLGYYAVVIRNKPDDLHVDLKAYDACVAKNATSDWHVEFLSEGSVDTATPKIEEAKPFLTAFIKWDGCAEFWYREAQNHFCGKKDAMDFGKLHERLYDAARELLSDCWLEDEEDPNA